MNMVRRVVEKLVLSSLGRNRIFGDGLLQVHWVSKIILTKNREDEIKNVSRMLLLNFTILMMWAILTYLLRHFKRIQ